MNDQVWDGTTDVELTCDGLEGLRFFVTAGSMTLSNGTPVEPGNSVALSINQESASQSACKAS